MFVCIPFIATLLALALIPLLAPALWHKNYKIILIILAALGLMVSPGITQISHNLINNYLPFIVLIGGLYLITGGILININFTPSGKNISCYLVFSAVVAGFIGTTGASMLFIQPLLKNIASLPNKSLVVIFYILMVGNMGGGLTPLGDPPLFIGFLQGVDFFWTFKNMFAPVMLSLSYLTAVFMLLNRIYNKNYKKINCTKANLLNNLIDGVPNLMILLIIVILIMLSAKIHLINKFLNIIIIMLASLSFWFTKNFKQHIYLNNNFVPSNFLEIFLVFLAIFCTLTPVENLLLPGNYLNDMLKNHLQSTLHYFYYSGFMSAFLDNAPTYLIFFKLTGLNAQQLMQQKTLLAISMGSVFMGALSYIGNAPNLIIHAAAQQNNITMPSFFKYCLFAMLIFLPLSVILYAVFLR